MALTAQQWKIIEKRTGVPQHIMQVLLGRGERSSQSSVSPKGATGRAQLMPGTARNLEKKYGINTRTEFGNILGGAYYLGEQKKNFGSWRLAFAAYNAGPGAVRQYHGVPPYKETEDYVRRTMQALGAAAPDGPSTASSSSQGLTSSPGGSNIGFTPPDFASVAQDNLSHIASGAGESATDALGANALAVQASKSSAQIQNLPATLSGPQGAAQPQVQGKGRWQQYVRLAKGADRQGVPTHQELLQFVGMLGIRAGRRLTIGTGSNHNEYVAGTKRQSAHWVGRAGDIPASGKTLTSLGRQALILAGMSPAEAMKARGGIYNVGGYQIIFNTNEGGNHFNHLHVGLRG